MQLRIQWCSTVHSLLNIWVFRLWGPRLRNKAFWGVVSVAAVVGLHRLSDEPYYCGQRRPRGRHIWGRTAEGGMEIVQGANVGVRRLAGWFRERQDSSRYSDKAQQTEDQPEVQPEITPEVRPEARPEVRAEPEVEDDYDLCEFD